MKINELLAEEKRDKYCSDKCCGSNVKAEDCKCPPTCKHCNCNDPTVSETTSAGGVAAVAMPIGDMQSRTGPKKKKTKSKKA